MNCLACVAFDRRTQSCTLPKEDKEYICPNKPENFSEITERNNNK